MFRFGKHGATGVPFDIQASAGNIFGVSNLFKYGRNPSVGITEEAIWDVGGAYSFLISAEKLSVYSSSTSDISGGAGAWSVLVIGLDSSFNEISETFILNGTTGVSSTNYFLRVYRAYVIQSGSTTHTTTNIGNITIQSKTTSTILAQINATMGQTLMAVYTVPNGYSFFLKNIVFNVGQGKQALFRIRTRSANIENDSFRTKFVLDVYENTLAQNLSISQTAPEKTDIVISCQMSSTPEATASASFTGYLFKNESLYE